MSWANQDADRGTEYHTYMVVVYDSAWLALQKAMLLWGLDPETFREILQLTITWMRDRQLPKRTFCLPLAW